MAFPDILIGSKFDGKGFKQAETAVGKLNKSVKNLSKTFGYSLGAAAVVQFGKVTVKAFMDDQKAAAQLSNTIKNLGLSFADADIQKFVEQLSLATGVADDELRPAMQRLLQTTGSVVQSQKLLATAIDISKGSGTDMATVALDLANAYVGNNKGLKKYTLGLSAAELKVASFDDVLKAFNRNFRGAGKADLATVAGQFGLITTAAKEAEETIGSGLVDAFKILAGNTGVSDLSKKITTLATNIADFFRGLAIGFRDLANMPVIKQLLQLTGLMLKVIGKAAGFVIDPFVKAGKDSRATGYGDYSGSTDAITREKNAQAAAKAEAAARKRAKEILAAQTKNTAELKKQAALKKAGTVFDMEQIQLVAALKNQLSTDERKRVELQLALLNENDVVATNLTKQILMAQDATGGLYQYFLKIGDTKVKNPFSFLDDWIIEFQKKLDSLKAPAMATTISTNAGVTTTAVAPTSGMVENFTPYLTAPTAQPGSSGFIGPVAPTSAPIINVTVQGNIIKEQELIQQIQNGTQLASLSGSPSQIGRIAGMFG